MSVFENAQAKKDLMNYVEDLVNPKLTHSVDYKDEIAQIREIYYHEQVKLNQKYNTQIQMLQRENNALKVSNMVLAEYISSHEMEGD